MSRLNSVTPANHSRKVVSHVMQLAASPGEVFPLLCPVREYEWIDVWQCEMIHSASGVAEAGAVFRTAFPQDGPPDVWVTRARTGGSFVRKSWLSRSSWRGYLKGGSLNRFLTLSELSYRQSLPVV